MILDLKSAGAEAIYSVPTPPQSIMIVKQMKELNYAPKVTCFIRGPDLSTYGDAMGKDADYVISDGNWDETMKFPGNDRVVKDYRAQYPDVASIGIPVGCAYAAIQILAKAIEMAGTLDREKIRRYHWQGGDDDGERSDQVQTEQLRLHRLWVPAVAEWEECPDLAKRGGRRCISFSASMG